MLFTAVRRARPRRSCSATVSLRVSGIAFAMVTLAFAQAGVGARRKNPRSWTGGEEGFGVDYTKLPDAFVGVFNTQNLYWLALGYLGVVFFDRALGGRLVARAASGRRSARTSCASRCSACARARTS